MGEIHRIFLDLRAGYAGSWRQRGMYPPSHGFMVISIPLRPVGLGEELKMLTATSPTASPIRRFPLWMLFAGMTAVAVQCAFGMPGDAIVLMSFAAYGFIAGWIYDERNSDSLFENGREVSYHVFARPLKIVASFCFAFPILFRLYYIISGTRFINPNIPDGPVLSALIFPSQVSTWLFFSGDRREPMLADLLGGYLIGCTITASVGCMIGFCWGNVRQFVLPVRTSDKELPSSS